MKGTKIISGFPGIGKTYLFGNANTKDLVIADSDSSKFSRYPWPENYIDHIKGLIGKVDIVMVSSHAEVRQALQDEGLKYTLVYPAKELKESYISRYKFRGSPQNFVEFIEGRWDEFLDDIAEETFPTKIELKEGEFLSDHLL